MTRDDEDRLVGIRLGLAQAAAFGMVHPYDHPNGVVSFLLRLLDEQAEHLKEIKGSDDERPYISLAAEACGALSRATWFAQYLEKRFLWVRNEERRRCVRITNSIGDDGQIEVDWTTAYAIAARIKTGESP